MKLNIIISIFFEYDHLVHLTLNRERLLLFSKRVFKVKSLLRMIGSARNGQGV